MLVIVVAYSLWQWKCTFKILFLQFQLTISQTTRTSVWFYFNARLNWKMPLHRINRWTTKTGSKLYFWSRTRYWTHCFGKTNVFGCSWQVWCFWKEYPQWIMFLFSKFSTVSHDSSIATLLLFSLNLLQLLILTLLRFATINTQPNKIQGEHWIMIANFCQTLYFAGTLGREKYSVLPAPVQTDDARTTTVPSLR